MDLNSTFSTRDISLNKDVVESKTFKDIFIKDWPVAKTALEMLKTALKNPIVKWVITIVISAGDAVYNELTA